MTVASPCSNASGSSRSLAVYKHMGLAEARVGAARCRPVCSPVRSAPRSSFAGRYAAHYPIFEPMTLVASVVVVACGLFLMGVAGVVFTRRALAERFLMSFASSARTHYVEQALRLLMGASLVVLSPAMWQASMFRVLGWAIVISSAALILIPWRWHHRLGKWVLPMVVRRMKVYAVGLFAFGALLLYGVFAAGSAA